MEIIYKNNKKKSNFTYYSELFKNKKLDNTFGLGYCPIGQNIIENRDFKFNKEIEGKLYLDYPLSVVVEQNIKFDSLYSLIQEIKKAYREIYKNRESAIKYGIWGHDIYDLILSSIYLYNDNSIKVGIDS